MLFWLSIRFFAVDLSSQTFNDEAYAPETEHCGDNRSCDDDQADGASVSRSQSSQEDHGAQYGSPQIDSAETVESSVRDTRSEFFIDHVIVVVAKCSLAFLADGGICWLGVNR